MSWKNNPVFILGYPKSGTSLLTALLDSHPELVVLPEESDYYNVIWPYARMLNYLWRASRNKKNVLLLRKITKSTHIKNLFRGKVLEDISGNLDYANFNGQRFQDILFTNIKRSKNFRRRDILVNLISAYFETDSNLNQNFKKQFWVEKTPRHLWHISSILRDFPQAKFIFIYRDPRDNYVSYKKKWGDKLTPLAFAKAWNKSLYRINKANQGAILYIKYEDLVSNPIAQLEKVASFLSIGWDNVLTEPSKRGNPWRGNSMFGKSMDSISKENLGRYKKVIKNEDLIIIESYCQRLMNKYGYELEKNQTELIKLKSYLPYHKIKLFNLTDFSVRKFLVLIRLLLTGNQN